MLKNLKNIILVGALFLFFAGCAQQSAPVQQATPAILPPKADFTASPREGRAPLAVIFTALTTGEINRWQWEFGDGQFSSEPAPSHTYTSEGEFTVSLTVAGPGGSDTNTKAACINIEGTIINWKEAANYIGQNKVVEGIIVDTYYHSDGKGKPTFLNFNKPYKGYFTCLIWGSNRDKFTEQFPPNPETYLLNKRVLVKGRIEEYPQGSGVPEIILKDPSQIEVVEK